MGSGASVPPVDPAAEYAGEADSAGGLPSEFVQRLGQLYPATVAAQIVRSFAQEKRAAGRANTLLDNAEAVVRRLLGQGLECQPFPWYPPAFHVPAAQRGLLTHSAETTAGRVFVQDPSSMLAALALAPQPGEEVLDLAAAPGGKALLMAALMQDRGRLAVVESNRRRFFRLRANLQRAGVTIARGYLADGRGVGAKVPERFDRVLLDAPCSGEARFQAGVRSSCHDWSLKKVARCAYLQRALLRSAAASLKPGGWLLYATCTFSPEENELVLNDLLSQPGAGFRVEPLELPVDNVLPGLTCVFGRRLDASLAGARRIVPDGLFGGFFLALLRKGSGRGRL